MQGSLWRSKTIVSSYTFSAHLDGPEPQRYPVGTFFLLEGAVLVCDLFDWKNSIHSMSLPSLFHTQEWALVLMPQRCYMNRTYFNRDSLWMERVV